MNDERFCNFDFETAHTKDFLLSNGLIGQAKGSAGFNQVGGQETAQFQLTQRCLLCTVVASESLACPSSATPDYYC